MAGGGDPGDDHMPWPTSKSATMNLAGPSLVSQLSASDVGGLVALFGSSSDSALACWTLFEPKSGAERAHCQQRR